MDMQRKLPAPTQVLSDDILRSLRAIYDAVMEAMPDAAPLLLCRRHEQIGYGPGEALRLPLSHFAHRRRTR